MNDEEYDQFVEDIYDIVGDHRNKLLLELNELAKRVGPDLVAEFLYMNMEEKDLSNRFEDFRKAR